MDVNASAAPGVGQHSALDTTKLPADHAPKFFAEAKRVFEDSRPPFVTTPGNNIEGSKRPVFIAENGRRPVLPIRTNLVAKQWGRLGIFWTLDLDGERFIVQSFPNGGCVSGAKWVYCRWTGVGEEFEDLPVAFSCINGEYTSVLGPRTESTAGAHQPTANNDTLTSATASSRHRNSPPNFKPLHEDHPVEYLDEAKAVYAASRPPFVIRKTRKPHRRVLLAMQDGQFSAASTEAEVVYRNWDLMDDYPTLDLDSKRFIVMGNAGGNPGGYQYHLWLGSKAGRVKKVIAYCGQYADAGKKASDLTEQLPEVDEVPSSSSSSGDEKDQDPQAGTAEFQQFFYDDFRKAFDPTSIPPPMPSKFNRRRSINSSEPSAQTERPRRDPKPTKRARSPTSPANSGSRKGKAPADAPKRASCRTRHNSDDSSTVSSPPYDTPAPTPSINDAPAPAPASEPQNHQPQPPDSLPTLTLYKQTHTTLRATRDSNIIGFVPLRLLTCMTMSTLFSSVIAASGHREDSEPIKCLMAIFDWKAETDVYKTIYIERGTEGSFEIFLEIIDEAPCWKDEGGKCGIAVEVVRA